MGCLANSRKPPSYSAQRNSCSACGASLLPDAAVCPVCGAPAALDRSDRPPTTEAPRALPEANDAHDAALALLEEGDAAAAAMALQDASRREGGLAPAEYALLGQALQALGMPEEAERALYAAVRAAPDDVDVRLSAALFCRSRGEAAEARDHLVIAQALDPDNAEIAAELATLRESFRQAEPACESLLRVARSELARGADAAAIDAARRAHHLHPEHPGTLRTLVELLEKTDRLDEAGHFALRLAEARPDDGGVRALVQRLDARRQVRERGAAAAREAIRGGDAARDYRAYHHALVIVSDALALEPNDPGLHVARGIALDRYGWLADAAEAYRTALRCDPSNEEARERLNGLLQAQEATERVLRERPAIEKAESLKRSRALWRRRGAMRPPTSDETL